MTIDLASVAGLADLAARQEDLVTTAQCAELGIDPKVVARLCREGRWRRVARGVFDTDPAAERSWASRRRRGAVIGLLRVGPGAVAVGVSALAMYGIEGLPAAVPVEVSLGSHQHRTARMVAGGLPELRVRQYDRSRGVRELDGFLVADPRAALAQAVPQLPRRNAVAVMDSMLNKGLIDAGGLQAAHTLARGRRGVARTHGWWEEADGRAESPLETFGRLDCVDHGIPPDDLQVEIRDDDGILIGRGDLGWRLADGRWLFAEMDGRAYHEALPALLHDRHRQNELLLRGGAEILRFTHAETRRSGGVARVVMRALQRWGRAA